MVEAEGEAGAFFFGPFVLFYLFFLYYFIIFVFLSIKFFSIFAADFST